MNNIFDELEDCQNKLKNIQYRIKELIHLDKKLERDCKVNVECFEELKKLIPENELWTMIRNLVQETVTNKQKELRGISKEIDNLGRIELFESETDMEE